MFYTDPTKQALSHLSEASMLREAADLKIRDAARDMERLEQMQREARAGGHSYNVVRVVRALTPDGGGGLRHGLEAETAQELAKMRGPGYAHNPHSPLVPWAAIASRTLLQVGTGSLGGYVVGHPAVSVSEALRGWSVGLDGGVQALEGLVSDVHIGAESGSVSAGWIAEPGTGTFSNPTFGTVHLKPRTLAGAVHMSGRLFNQGPLAESLVKSSLQREAGKLFDRAIFNGTGGDEPTGILNTSGVNSLTGTGLDLADLLDEQQQIASAGVVDANHRWIGNPHMRELLGGREKSSGSGKYLWEDDRVLNRPAVVSNEIPAASITHGDLSQCVLGLWGGGFELGFDPYSNGNFQAFRYSFRVLLSADVGVLQPTALRSIEGIT